jgi:hypothetical protein
VVIDPTIDPQRDDLIRSHGHVISAHTMAISAVPMKTYHGHGPIRSSSDAVEGFRFRKP